VSRAARRQKLEAQLRSLEEQFSSDLVAALRECAAGTWGLFGQNDALAVEMPLLRSAYMKTAEALIHDGEEIEELRRELGFNEAFNPYKRFVEFRKMRGSNVPGEPKLAVQFLMELEIESN
jgi:hypothetical protein